MISEEKLLQMTVDNALAIATLTEVSKRTSEDVDKLIKYTAKVENIQKEHAIILGKVGHVESIVFADKKKLKWVYTAAEYKKITAILLIVAYLFALSDVRHAIGVQLEPLVTFVKNVKSVL